MSISQLDVYFRKLLLTKFFTKGWGLPRHIEVLFTLRKLLSNRETCYRLVPKNYPIKIRRFERNKNYQIIDGCFYSPFALLFPEVVPPAIQNVHFQMILPDKWPNKDFKPVCIHLAGTGDHYFWRRRNIMVLPLIKLGIGGIILENPYYGFRKPREQLRSSLHYVSDLFVMGGCLILEGIVLLNWCEYQWNLGPLGVTGISMGGHMASLVASNWPKPLVLVICLSWSTASSAFTDGVLSKSIDWQQLQEQYSNNKLYCEHLSKSCKIVDNPFNFNRNYHNDNYITPYDLINNNRTIINPKSHKITGKRNDEASRWFMKGLLDECTHLKNFSIPVDTSLITVIRATSDGYVPIDRISRLDDIWPGTTIKYLNCGHIGACLWHRKSFRDTILETFNKIQKS